MKKHGQSFLPVFVMTTLSIFLVELSFCLLMIRDFHSCLAEFVLFKWSKMSTKYANLDFQLSSQSKL